LKYLVTVEKDKTVFTTLRDCYTRKVESQLIQTSETTFWSKTASSTQCKMLRYLVLIAFAMRSHQNLPKAPIKKNLKTIPRVKANQKVLQRFAALAEQLGFNSPQIKALKGDLDPLSILVTQESVPLLVTTGLGESMKQRCRRLHANTFEEDRKYLFLQNLCKERDETSEGITSFFVLKSWFSAFFNLPQCKRPVLSTKNPNSTLPQAHHQHVDKDDVNIEDSRPRSPDQREQEQEQEQQQIIQVQDPQRIDKDKQIQETIEFVQQIMSDYAKEANRRLDERETHPSSSSLFGNLSHL
jgi:hypothetical protein